jgi:hypothetical protein
MAFKRPPYAGISSCSGRTESPFLLGEFLTVEMSLRVKISQNEMVIVDDVMGMRRMPSSGMSLRVAPVRTDVSEKYIAQSLGGEESVS